MSKRTVQREHFRFAVSGFGVVLFKFLADGRFSKKRFRPLLWPFCVAFLGILLILYRE